MKKLFPVVLVFVFVLSFVACGGGGVDAKDVIKEQIGIMKTLTTDLEGATDAAGVAKALNNCCDKMEKMIPKIKAVNEKHPELANMGQGKLPEEFKEFNEEMAEVMTKFMGVAAKMTQYAQDPQVMEANKRFMEIQGKLK